MVQLSEGNEDYRIVHDISDMAKVTSGITYQKGAWFLNMLCNYIGEESFHGFAMEMPPQQIYAWRSNGPLESI